MSHLKLVIDNTKEVIIQEKPQLPPVRIIRDGEDKPRNPYIERMKKNIQKNNQKQINLTYIKYQIIFVAFITGLVVGVFLQTLSGTN